MYVSSVKPPGKNRRNLRRQRRASFELWVGICEVVRFRRFASTDPVISMSSPGSTPTRQRSRHSIHARGTSGRPHGALSGRRGGTTVILSEAYEKVGNNRLHHSVDG